MLQETFRDNAMSQSKFFLCYKCFKDGRKSVDDDERSGGPSASTTPENVAKVGEAIPADRRQSIHDLCEVIGLSYGTVLRILADNLNTRRISARFLPRLLSDDQKAHRVFVCRELKQQARDDPNFISSIITGDETWVYGYDPETKQQSSQWKSPNSPRPKKARQVRSNVKSMLIVFFGIQEIVDKEFVPPGQTVNDKFYCWGFEASEGGIRRKRPYKWKNSNWFCPPWQRDRSHITRCSTIPDFQKHYSYPPLPFAWPRPLRLFPMPQDEITAERASFWHDWGDSRRIARGYRHIFENFHGCVKSWETRWDRCIHAQGNYFEGDGGN